jgi:uncharacterized protein YdaU (DUF1376 family)
MARKPLPYYPFYVDAFDEGVLSLNIAEVGLYVLALGHAWKYGSIPDDPNELARLIRRVPSQVRKAWPNVRPKWIEKEPGKLVNGRQEAERLKAIEKSDKAANSVRSRYKRSSDVSSDVASNEHTSALLRASGSVCLSSSSEVTSNSENTSTREAFTDLPFDPLPTPKIALVKLPIEEWFAEFWALYWRKVGRAEALKAFKKHVEIKGDRLLSEAKKCLIIAAVQAQTPQYMARDSEHRPHASTWLNMLRYEDDPEVYQPAKSATARLLEDCL